MEELIKKVEGVLDQFFREEAGNRLSQFGFRTLKEIIISEIANYKINKAKPCIPISNKKAEENKKEKEIS